MSDLYSSAEVKRLTPLLDDMINNQDKYLWEDIEDMAAQFHSAVLCEEIDRSILEEVLALHNASSE